MLLVFRQRLRYWQLAGSKKHTANSVVSVAGWVHHSHDFLVRTKSLYVYTIQQVLGQHKISACFSEKSRTNTCSRMSGCVSESMLTCHFRQPGSSEIISSSEVSFSTTSLCSSQIFCPSPSPCLFLGLYLSHSLSPHPPLFLCYPVP